MADLTTFQTPYGAGKNIEGYIKGNVQKRPLLFKQSFNDINTTWRDTVNYDIEFNKRNLMGQFVDPEADTYRVQLPNFGTKELSFAYSKEHVGSPNYQEINQRMLAQQPNTVSLDRATLARNVASNMQQQFALAYERFENLYELSRANILVHGTFSTTLADQKGQHKEVKWDMERTKYSFSAASTQAARDANKLAIFNELVPEADLTSIKANTASDVAGGMSWDSKDSTNSNAAVTPAIAVSPVKHVNRMLDVAAYRSGTDYIVMGNDAWSWYLNDVNTTYKEQAQNTFDRTQPLVMLDLYPHPQEIEGLTLQGFVIYGGSKIPTYTYNGMYHDRSTGAKTRFMPEGYVLLVPPSQYGAIRFGKIMHYGAMWAAQQFWINSWKGEKSKIEEYEIHTNFAVYHTEINSAISWKVCSSGKQY